MIRQDLSARSAALRASRVPFVHARVVFAERPTSAKPGDEAIVLADGAMEGFVGGDCAEATVRQQSLDALPSGESVLLRITPEPEPDQPGKRVVHNPCLSGGTLEVFLEPSLPPPLVHVLGDSPTANAVMALGQVLGYAMARYEGALEPDAAALVVASHGKGEEGAALSAGLEAGVPYVGLVASRRRGEGVLASLRVSDELRAKVHTPAGLDIGAATAEEVALSILAEIVACHPKALNAARPPLAALRRETDPVCGMAVLVTDETSTAHHEGRQVWFCGRVCRRSFLADPDAFPLPVGH
jgi:xanthine dehydrogenase accessory factor